MEERTLRSETDLTNSTQECQKLRSEIAILRDEKTSIDRKMSLGENYKKKLESDLKEVKGDKLKVD
jgi:hypothetical protein